MFGIEAEVVSCNSPAIIERNHRPSDEDTDSGADCGIPEIMYKRQAYKVFQSEQNTTETYERLRIKSGGKCVKSFLSEPVRVGPVSGKK